MSELSDELEMLEKAAKITEAMTPASEEYRRGQREFKEAFELLGKSNELREQAVKTAKAAVEAGTESERERVRLLLDQSMNTYEQAYGLAVKSAQTNEAAKQSLQQLIEGAKGVKLLEEEQVPSKLEAGLTDAKRCLAMSYVAQARARFYPLKMMDTRIPFDGRLEPKIEGYLNDIVTSSEKGYRTSKELEPSLTVPEHKSQLRQIWLPALLESWNYALLILGAAAYQKGDAIMNAGIEEGRKSKEKVQEHIRHWDDACRFFGQQIEVQELGRREGIEVEDRETHAKLKERATELLGQVAVLKYSLWGMS
ncbi:hypothetical protein HYU20_01275 [Candidatus Woesearchaeota archaeon]|nr:hypothetical protein [Candidatus Woesearchaeota archaeon]